MQITVLPLSLVSSREVLMLLQIDYNVDAFA